MTSRANELTRAAQASGARSLRVLCAEDDEHVATMLRFALERGGHHVELAKDGNEAFKRLADSSESFDVLVTDHDMPALSGLRLVEKLRAAHFAGKIIVHCSALRAQDAAAYRTLGVDHIFNKPVSLDKFLSVVQQLGTVAL